MIAWASYPYEGTVVIVTGAGSGIGRAVARAFLEQGASVAVAGRRRGPLRETVEGFADDRWLIADVDLSTEQGVAELVAAAARRWSGIDVVIANAGTSEPGTIDDLDAEAWQRMRSVNVDGVILLARAAMPHLRARRGTLIAMSSVAGFGGDWRQAGYNATKGAVNALVQSMALDEGRAGVRVNAIAPAFTRSALTQERLDDPEFSAALFDRLALDRVAEPEDVARAALFLASPDAGYITGVILPVDGGTTASTGTPRPIR